MTVVDASAVIELLLRTPLGDRCTERLLDARVHPCAPHLLDVEVTQVLHRYAREGLLTPERGQEALRDLLDLPLARYPHTPLVGRMWELRDVLSAYDAAYVALAEALDAPLITCDERITRAPLHRARVEVMEA